MPTQDGLRKCSILVILATRTACTRRSDTCTLMFIADYSQWTKGGSNASVHQCMNERKVVHSYNGYYLAIKRNKVLIHAPAWLKLVNVMLSERSQSQNTTQYMTP